MAAADVTEDDFPRAVLDRSQEIPVVVDFWAPWCGPCRSLTPVLEAAAEARAGRVVLVKVDTEESPNLAAHYGVHGIPAVKAFRDRDVVAQFVGARAPAKVAAFFEALEPGEVDDLIAAGDEASLRAAVELDRRRTDAAVALARLLHRRGDDDGALAALAPAAGHFAADGLAARIRLAAAGSGAAAGSARRRALAPPRAWTKRSPRSTAARPPSPSTSSSASPPAPATTHPTSAA